MYMYVTTMKTRLKCYTIVVLRISLTPQPRSLFGRVCRNIYTNGSSSRIEKQNIFDNVAIRGMILLTLP